MAKKGSLAVLIGMGKKPSSDDDSDEEMNDEGDDDEEGSEGLQAVADEMMDAFEAKDREGLAAALKSFKRMC